MCAAHAGSRTCCVVEANLSLDPLASDPRSRITSRVTMPHEIVLYLNVGRFGSFICLLFLYLEKTPPFSLQKSWCSFFYVFRKETKSWPVLPPSATRRDLIKSKLRFNEPSDPGLDLEKIDFCNLGVWGEVMCLTPRQSAQEGTERQPRQ